MRALRILASVLFVYTCSLPAQADLILTAPPREDASKGDEMYGPIAEFLSKQLGQKVVYERPESWEQYAIDMRKDKYDIVFDGPHFGAWRIKHLQHTPLVKLPGELVFKVIARKDDPKAKKLRNLVSQKTCGIKSPNLSMLTYLSQFQNASHLPPVVEISGDMPEVYKAFKEGQCNAAVVRDNFYENGISPEDKKNLNILYTSTPLPNQTVTVSKRVDATMRKKIEQGLLASTGNQSSLVLLKRYSKTNPTFVMAEPAGYDGAEKYLEGIVWGW